MRGQFFRGNRSLLFILSITFFLTASLVTRPALAQGSANNLGNGGKHSIQGRLYVSGGTGRSELVGKTIRLVSFGFGELSVVADGTGTFIFRNLNPGSYYVVIEGGDSFEDVREQVVIDEAGSTSMSGLRISQTPRTANVQVYLKPKAGAQIAIPSVINAELEKAPKDARELFIKAQNSAQAGDLPKAISELQQATKIYPEFALAHNELGLLYAKNDDLIKAIESFKAALKLNRDSFSSRLNLGIAFLNQKKLAEAEAQLVAAAIIDPNAVTPHYYIGLVSVEKKDLAIAQAAFEKAKELTGKKPFPMLHRYLGGVYMAVKKWPQAAVELETYLKEAPDAKDAAKIKTTIAELKAKPS